MKLRAVRQWAGPGAAGQRAATGIYDNFQGRRMCRLSLSVLSASLAVSCLSLPLSSPSLSSLTCPHCVSRYILHFISDFFARGNLICISSYENACLPCGMPVILIQIPPHKENNTSTRINHKKPRRRRRRGSRAGKAKHKSKTLNSWVNEQLNRATKALSH